MPTKETVMDKRAQARPLLAAVRSDERGAMMIEVLVSAVLLIVVSLATLAVIDRAQEVAGANRARSVATALGQKDQDRLRQWPFSRFDSMIDEKIATPGQTYDLDGATGRPVDVDGRVYNVKTTLVIEEDPDQAITACLAGWEKKKVKIRTEVESPAGHKIKPVVMESFRVPQISDKESTGSVIVKLMRADGTGAEGVDVSVTEDTVGGASVNGETQADGCVVFNDITEGKKVVSWQEAGWGDENGAPKVSRFVTVAAGNVSQMAGRFDQLVDRTVKFVTDGGEQAQWRSATLVNGGITKFYHGRRTFVNNNRDLQNSTLAAGLFPFVNEYAVFASDCWSGNPDVWPGSSVAPPSFTVATSGATVEAYMPLVKVRVNNRNPAASTAYYARARPRNPGSLGGYGGWGEMSGCQDLVTHVTGVGALNGTNDSNGDIKVAMPWGLWSLCVSNGTNSRTVNFNNTPEGDASVTAPEAPYVAPTKDFPTNGAGTRGTNVNMSGAPAGACGF